MPIILYVHHSSADCSKKKQLCIKFRNHHCTERDVATNRQKDRRIKRERRGRDLAMLVSGTTALYWLQRWSSCLVNESWASSSNYIQNRTTELRGTLRCRHVIWINEWINSLIGIKNQLVHKGIQHLHVSKQATKISEIRLHYLGIT